MARLASRPAKVISTPEALEAACQKLGYDSYAETARALNVSASYLSHLLKGKRPLNRNLEMRIFKLAGGEFVPDYNPASDALADVFRLTGSEQSPDPEVLTEITADIKELSAVAQQLGIPVETLVLDGVKHALHLHSSDLPTSDIPVRDALASNGTDS